MAKDLYYFFYTCSVGGECLFHEKISRKGRVEWVKLRSEVMGGSARKDFPNGM